MTSSAEVAANKHPIFTTSFSGLRAVVTSQRIWFGFAWDATYSHTEWERAWKDGSWDSPFERTFRLFFLLGGVGQIVYVGDAIGTGP